MENPPVSELPTTGRLAGIDYGLARIGIAISDPGQQFASPFETYHPRNPVVDAEYFCGLVERESVVGFVIGIPIHLSGEESRMSHATREFAGWLSENTNCPVAFIDERFTTAAAREILSGSGLSGKKRKAQLDKLAAQILLAAFLEKRPSVDPGSLED